MFVDHPKINSANEIVSTESVEEINESNQELLSSELKTLNVIIELSNDAINNLDANNQYNSEDYNNEVSRSVRFVNSQNLDIQQSKSVVGKRYELFADDLKKSQGKYDGTINIFNNWHRHVSGLTRMSIDEFNSLNEQIDSNQADSSELDVNLANSVNEVEKVIEHINDNQYPEINNFKNQTNKILKDIYDLDSNDYRTANGMPDIDELNRAQIKLVSKLDETLDLLNQQIINDIRNTEQLASDTKGNFQPKNETNNSHRLELESMFK